MRPKISDIKAVIRDLQEMATALADESWENQFFRGKSLAYWDAAKILSERFGVTGTTTGRHGDRRTE